MAIEVLDDILDAVHYTYNSLKTVVEEVSKKWQELADIVAPDPDADNSNYQFTVPRQFYATCYTKQSARSATDKWNGYYYGYQEAGFAFQLSLNDNVLTMTKLTCLGKCVTEGGGQPEKWNYLNAAQQEECLNDIKSYFESQTYQIVSDYPDSPTVFNYSTYGVFGFKPTGHSTSDIHWEYNEFTGDVSSNQVAAQMVSVSPTLDTETGLISNLSASSLKYGTAYYIAGEPFEAVMDNESNARNWVNSNGATHNYETSYLVYGGTMTVFYGDNYIIYVIPSGVKVSYNVMYNVTKTISEVLNTDNPGNPPINVPTYDEVKYPPEPAPGTWDSIESSGTYGGALQFVRSFYVSATTLANLKSYMGKTESQGGPPDGYDMLESIIAIKMYPFALADTAEDSINISLTNPGGTWTELMRNNFIAQVASAITGTPYPGTEPPQVRIINTGETGHATDAAMRNYS